MFFLTMRFDQDILGMSLSIRLSLNNTAQNTNTVVQFYAPVQCSEWLLQWSTMHFSYIFYSAVQDSAKWGEENHSLFELKLQKVGVCKPWSLLPLVVLGIVPQRTSGTKTWALTCDVFKVRRCVHNHKTWKKIEKHLQFEHNNLHVLHSIVWVWWEYFQPDRVIRASDQSPLSSPIHCLYPPKESPPKVSQQE